MYDSTTGRFLSQDPIGFAAGDANLYRYVGNQPTSKTDPTGLEELVIKVHPVETSGMIWHEQRFVPGLNDKGQQEWHFGKTWPSAIVRCDFEKQIDGTYTLANFKIFVYLGIYIDQKNIRDWRLLNPDDLDPPTLKGIYGHEQLHVRNTKKWIKKFGLKEIQEMLDKSEKAGLLSGLGDTDFACPTALETIQSKVYQILYKGADSIGHGGALDPGIPVSNKNYPPLGGNAMPGVPKPIPPAIPKEQQVPQ